MIDETDDLQAIPSRLADVRQKIHDAARRAGRPGTSVRLIAVSKGKPASSIRAAYAAGQRDFGENYAQELEEKARALGDLEGIVWHAIGRIQRNKVKTIVPIATFIHAIDRGELALQVAQRALALGKTINVLLEVNITGEAGKGGCAPGELPKLVEVLAGTQHVSLVGLMTIPPASEVDEDARPVFAALRALRDRHCPSLSELSMGMSHDYAIAIEEGATLVRVGTAIFGARTGSVAVHPG